METRTIFSVIIAACVLLCGLPAIAQAEIYHFTEIATSPGAAINYSFLTPSINDSGEVAYFFAHYGGDKGIFVGDGATTSTHPDP